jgi:hypothetical protein
VPWDVVVLPPGDDPAFSETMFGSSRWDLVVLRRRVGQADRISTSSGSADSAAYRRVIVCRAS